MLFLLAYHIQMQNQRWGKYYGNEQFYRIFGIKEEKILESLAFAQDGKTDIYIIDVGCAYGGWGTMVMQFLNKNCQDSGKHFHIFSLTGGREQEESIKTVGNATHYRFNEFKAENIDEELLKRGFDLHEKADLIVANWTLRHMVDPLGCLQRLYSLLSPGTGMLLSNSFYFVDEKNPDVIKNILDEWELLASATSGIFAYNPTDFNGCLGDFLLVRLDLAPLTIPLEYAGIKKGIDTRALDTNGGALPIFKKDEQIQKKEPMIVKTSMNSYFCDPASQQSKRFLEYLIDQQILF